MKVLNKMNIATRTERFNHNSFRLARQDSLPIIDANRISVRIEVNQGRPARTPQATSKRNFLAQSHPTCRKTALWVDKVA